jgi:hypothetical protein
MRPEEARFIPLPTGSQLALYWRLILRAYISSRLVFNKGRLLITRVFGYFSTTAFSYGSHSVIKAETATVNVSFVLVALKIASGPWNWNTHI